MSTFEVYVVLLRIIEMILRQKKKLSNVLSSLNLTIAISIHYDDQSKYYAFFNFDFNSINIYGFDDIGHSVFL